MLLSQITSNTVSEMLDALRKASALRNTPLLDLDLVTLHIRSNNLTDTQQSREWALGQVLHDMVDRQLVTLRGGPASKEHARQTPGQELEAIDADFREQRLEQQAWSLLHFRYLSSCDMTLVELANRLGVSRKTLHRRLTTGHDLLVGALREAERLAAQSASEHGNLPTMRTSFVGRESEQRALRQLIREKGVVTLTGAGGIGKSRLAIETASLMRVDYPDGVWWIDLVPLAADSVDMAAARALHIREDPANPVMETLVSALRRRRMLLVVDNCEHVLQASAELIDRLVRCCPNVDILATSRESLHVHGEQVFDVGPLKVSEAHILAPLALAESEAIQLFVDRASAVKRGWSPGESEWPVIADVCRQLDGLPLTIEMAAARLRGLSLTTIAEMMEDRFRLLSANGRVAPARHRSLEAVLDWSYELLDEPERTLLSRLSVFRGRFSVEAATAICSGKAVGSETVPDLLASLFDKSLVTTSNSQSGGSYRLLETVRAYARQRLEEGGATASLNDRHWTYYSMLAEQAEPELHGAEQAGWLKLLGAQHDDLRAALDWAMELPDVAKGMKLGASLARFWEVRGYSREGQDVLGRLLAHPEAQGMSPERAAAALALGSLMVQSNFSVANALLEESHELFARLGDAGGTTSALNALGVVAYEQGEYASARDYLNRGLALARQRKDGSAEADGLFGLGRVAWLERSDVVHNERSYYAESLKLYRESGDELLIAKALGAMGNAELEMGHFTLAEACYRESLEVYRRLGDEHGVALSGFHLGIMAATHGGDEATAQSLFEQALAVANRLGAPHLIAAVSNSLGIVSQNAGRFDEARAYYEEALAINREQCRDHRVADTLTNLGDLDIKCGDYQNAEAVTKESLRIRRQLGERNTSGTIQNLAMIHSRQGRLLRAARLLGASMSMTEAIGRQLSPGEVSELKAISTMLRAGLGESTLEETIARGRAKGHDEMVAYALGEVTWDDMRDEVAAGEGESSHMASVKSGRLG